MSEGLYIAQRISQTGIEYHTIISSILEFIFTTCESKGATTMAMCNDAKAI